MPKHRVDNRSLSTPFLLLGLLVAILLTGCAINPAQEEARLLAPLAGAPLKEADALAAQGKAGEAARAYLEIAKGVGPAAREQLQLKAVRAYLSVGDTQQARQVISQIARQHLTLGQREQLLLIEADLALLDGRPREAIARLESMQPATLPTALKTQRLGTLAAAQRLANEPIAAAHTLIELDRLLADEGARLLNQVSLVSSLSTLDDKTLQDLARNGKGGIASWAAIALVARTAGGDPAQFQTRYRQEIAGKGGSSAHPRLAEAYAEMLSGGYAAGNRLAILLPSGGRFGTAATAVQDGIQAARRLDTSGQQPAIQLLDSGNPERARDIHARAIKEGATHVIGPLQKEAVDRLASGPALAVPTLALNQTTQETRGAANLFQFSLSPENEAAEAASKAAAMGRKRALILYPSGAWGERLASAFRDQWQRLGGQIAGQSVYDPAARRHDKTLSKLVEGANADVLFLVATQEMAYQVYPQISLVDSSLTVIATSHVYSGAFQGAQDKVLAGLYFVDIPWMLDTEGEGPLSRRRLSGSSFAVANPLARLYAMGIDAYRIAPRLTDLARSPGAYYPGQTGGLSVDPLGRIQRQLALARFTESGVERVEDTGNQAAKKTP